METDQKKNECPYTSDEAIVLKDCLDEILSYNADIKRILEAKRSFVDGIVKQLTPSWFKGFCFVKVHYQELDYPEYEDGVRGQGLEWIDKVSDEMSLHGFTISEICDSNLMSFPVKVELSFDSVPIPTVSEIALVPILYRSKPSYDSNGNIVDHAGTRVTKFNGTNKGVRITGFEIIDRK